MTVTVGIVDGDELAGLTLACRLRAARFDVPCDPVRRGADLIESAGRIRPGIALLDLQLGPDVDGQEVDGVQSVGPLCASGWRVVVLTGSARRERLGAALAAGGFGWVPKNAPIPVLLRTLREAAAGRVCTVPSRRRALIALHRSSEQDRSIATR